MKLSWVQVGNGRMAVSHRPRLRAIPFLPSDGCDCVVTLLSKKEGAEQIGSLVQESRMRWIWVPLPDGNPPRVFPNGIVQIENALHEGASVLIHCSAGMHRTGMIALSVLRRTGMTEEKALDLIQAMRKETHAALDTSRKEWANSTVHIPG